MDSLLDRCEASDILTTFSKPLNEDDCFWWEIVGRILATMMQQAAYPTQAQYEGLDFFYHHIVPALGPRPCPKGGPPGWRSFMTDDHTPIELSWSWATGEQKPIVRFSIEPIEKGARTAMTCSKIPLIRRLLERTRPVCRSLDLTWFEHLAHRLTLQSPSNCATVHKMKPSNIEHHSQYFAAFDLETSGTIFKAYFLPGLRASRDGITTWDLVHSAVCDIAMREAPMQRALDMLASFIQSHSKLYQLWIEIVGIDCLPCELSRLKIYVRSRATSFNSIRQIMTLGGKLNHTGIVAGLNRLKTLWQLVLGLAPGISDDDELNVVQHRTAGMLYYFEFRPQADTPIPKLYIPVRHYARNDLQIAQGLMNYFGNGHGKGYVQMLQETLLVARPHVSTNFADSLPL